MVPAMLALPLAWAAIRKGAAATIKFAVSHPWQIAVGVLVVVLLVQGARLKAAHSAIESLRAELRGANSALQAARAANATADNTITSLRAANASLADAWAESQRTAQEAVAELKAWQDGQARRDAAARKREREVIYRDPTCETLARIDVFAACPALAGRLRNGSGD